MELKLDTIITAIGAISCFNRTFMELKCTKLEKSTKWTESSNRTFMELK